MVTPGMADGGGRGGQGGQEVTGVVVAPPLARLPVLHHLLSILIAIPGHVPPPPPRHAPPPIASVIFFHYSSFFLPYCQKLWGFLGGGGWYQHR